MDRPLYAKGFCKQCYLSKYKRKQKSIKPNFKSIEQGVIQMSDNSSDGSSSSQIEPEFIPIFPGIYNSVSEIR